MNSSPVNNDFKVSTSQLTATQVSKSPAQNGSEIGLGKRISFNNLEGKAGEKTAVAVASSWQVNLGNLLKSVTKTNPFTIKVLLSDGQKVDVNIRSLAKRLHVSKSELRNSEDVGELINSHVGILDRHQTEMQKVKDSTPLSSKTIMKIYKKALASPDSSGSAGKLSGHRFMWCKDVGSDALHIFTKTKRIGEGSFGDVSRTNTGKAFKEAKISGNAYDDKESREDIINSVTILEKLNSEGAIEGIVSCPKLVKIEAQGKQKEITAYLDDLYQANGTQVKVSDTKDLVKGFVQLFSALELMHSKGIYHGDIKLDNMAVDDDGKDWKYTDFGGAIDVSQGVDKESMIEVYDNQKIGLYTPYCCSATNYGDLHRAGRRGNVEEFKRALEKRDVLETSVAFLEKALGEKQMAQFFIYEKERNTATEGMILELKDSSYDKFEEILQKKGLKDIAAPLHELIGHCLTSTEQDSRRYGEAKNEFIEALNSYNK